MSQGQSSTPIFCRFPLILSLQSHSLYPGTPLCVIVLVSLFPFSLSYSLCVDIISVSPHRVSLVEGRPLSVLPDSLSPVGPEVWVRSYPLPDTLSLQ